MKRLILAAVAAVMAGPSPVLGQAEPNFDMKEWSIERGGRSRDPYVAPDGKVYFAGQQGNYVGRVDPATGEVRYYELEENTNPHTVIVDDQGIVWYAGNRNGRIGKLNPANGEIKTFMTGEARDPHTMHFDGKGNIWFSSQGASRIGRLNMTTGQVEVINPLGEQRANPYGLDLDSKGRLFVSLFATHNIAMVTPDMKLKIFPTVEGGRVRRNAVTPDGMVWYVDYARGYVGRLDPNTGQTKEWMSPGGAQSRPYAITADDEGRLWVSETGAVKKLVGFDPKTEKFFANMPVSNSIRHMMFDPKTKTMWFGTDSNTIGRVVTGRAIVQ
jgi:virginiamycin B lyase